MRFLGAYLSKPHDNSHRIHPALKRYVTKALWRGLRFCWAVLGAPTDKRLAPTMGELVPRLRRFEELELTDETADALVAMSAATWTAGWPRTARSWRSRAARSPRPGRC